MRKVGIAHTLALTVVAALALGAIAAAQQAKPASQQPPAPAALKTETRLITVDVVVTDGKGNIVRGLKQDDFQISEEHGSQQKITRFEFVDTSAPSPAANAVPSMPPGPGVFSNVDSTRFRLPPTVILMDALNTSAYHQLQVRHDMVLFLKKLPTDTPVAVFLLGHSLRVVQNFTSDPALLRAAVDKLNGPDMRQRNPQDDPDSPTNIMRSMTKAPEDVIERLEDFEKQEYADQTRERVEETADAMKAIAKYLGGYPGRKNLVWFSESFPLWIAPATDFGSDPFMGTDSYDEKVRIASGALADAQVAVYPVDARGLEPAGLYSVDQNPNMDRRNPGASLARNIQHENDDREESQATMEAVAGETGGETCKSTNDLAGCVQHELDQSSSYYELAYYPENVKWDGRFHRIVLKTSQKGLKLSYRRGYFATSTVPTAGHDDPEKLLKQACMAPLPSTSIALAVAAVPPAAGSPTDVRYLLTIPANSVTLRSDSASRAVTLQVAICEFDPKGDSFEFFERDLSRPVPDDVYKVWQERGIRNIFDYSAKPEDQRLRFAVLDVPSGVSGSIDVPAHPQSFAAVPGLPAAAPGPSAAAAPAPPKPPAQVVTKITFRAGSAASALDWSGDSLSYKGDLGIEQGAPAFFHTIYGAKFHCDGGNLVANDAASNQKPSYLFTFRNLSGQGALVELGGESPAYSGDLPVDASGRAFFDYFWKLCHCQQP
ncbi:MAG TPA: VWA domain-containing protein [Verrucomicrobiae bacterium]|nr:VWA domain-containing protein [Verrucomicrobiae bacterium]